MFKNVKAAAFKPRPFHTQYIIFSGMTLYTHQISGHNSCLPRKVWVFVSVCRALLSLCSSSLLFGLLFFPPASFIFSFLCLGWQTFRSGLSCLQYVLPMTVSPKMALTFTGLYRPILAPHFSYLLLSLCWCQKRFQKCFFWMLSVYIYSHKI